MNDFGRRTMLYGGAAGLLVVLGAAWSRWRGEADLMTLLSSADVQLRMAYTIAPEGRGAGGRDARDELIDAAESNLEVVERLHPGMAITAEFRGFAHMLRGRFLEAAGEYRRARSCADCQDEQRDVLAFNEARMLAKGGNREQALAVFAAHGAALDARFGHQRAIEEASLLVELGQRSEAERRLDAVLRDVAAPPMAALQAGQHYARLGHRDKAEAALKRARESVPIADYHLALLKLQQGEVDSGLELLERAASAAPAEVRRRLRDEAYVWSAVAHEARFRRLAMPETAAPGR